MSLGPNILRILEIRASFLSSGSFLDFGDFDHFGQASGPSARRGAAYVSGQNFAIFAIQKPRLGHMLEQTPLFLILLAVGALLSVSEHR